MGTLPLLLARAALAFEPTVNPLGAETAWDRMPVPWAYDDTGRPADVGEQEAREAVRAAFSAWNRVPGAGVRFVEVVDELKFADEVNVVGWQPAWRWDADILALTTTWSTDEGEIVGFRVLLNAQDRPWSTDGDPDRIDVQNTVTHEVGHALGLGHDHQHAEATMAPTASEGEVRKRDLHRSDEEGARYLYPGQGRSACDLASSPAGIWVWAAALLPAMRRRRNP